VFSVNATEAASGKSVATAVYNFKTTSWISGKSSQHRGGSDESAGAGGALAPVLIWVKWVRASLSHKGTD
jgi:hypothetical protein